MNKYVALLALTCASVTGCAPPPADTPVDTSADLAALKAEVLDWIASFNAGDADAVAALYTDDAVVIPPGAPIAKGRAAIRDFIAADFSGMQAQGLTYTGEASSDGAIDGDLGWVSGTGFVQDSSGATLGSARYLTIYERRDGEWQISRDTWNLGASEDPGRALAEAYIETWNSKDFDRIDSLMSADFKRSAPDQNADGPAELKAFMGNVHDTYANFGITLDASSSSGNMIFVAWTSTSNGLQGNESEETITVSGISMLRFTDGAITEEIVHYDTATLNALLGTTEVPHAE